MWALSLVCFFRAGCHRDTEITLTAPQLIMGNKNGVLNHIFFVNLQTTERTTANIIVRSSLIESVCLDGEVICARFIRTLRWRCWAERI